QPMQEQEGEFSPFQYGMPPELDQSNLVKQTDPSSEIMFLAHSLRAEYWDDKKEQWKRSGIKPLMNDRGVYKIIAIVSPFVTNNTRLSTLDDKEVRIFTLSFTKMMLRHMHLNKRNYEVDMSDMSAIIEMSENLIRSVFKRALNNGERNFMNKTIHATEANITHSYQNQEKQRPKFLQFWKK
ncbi:unnamed protein product, partial [marine sediment metagenome]